VFVPDSWEDARDHCRNAIAPQCGPTYPKTLFKSSQFWEQRVMTTYLKHGYASREEYLQQLNFEYNHIPEDEFDLMAELLGENEDFDGLVTFCEDYWNAA
jgi:hypothetical protein